MFCSDKVARHPRPLLGLMWKEKRAEVLKRSGLVLLQGASALGSKLKCYCFLQNRKDTETAISGSRLTFRTLK